MRAAAQSKVQGFMLTVYHLQYVAGIAQVNLPATTSSPAQSSPLQVSVRREAGRAQGRSNHTDTTRSNGLGSWDEDARLKKNGACKLTLRTLWAGEVLAASHAGSGHCICTSGMQMQADDHWGGGYSPKHPPR